MTAIFAPNREVEADHFRGPGTPLFAPAQMASPEGAKSVFSPTRRAPL